MTNPSEIEPIGPPGMASSSRPTLAIAETRPPNPNHCLSYNSQASNESGASSHPANNSAVAATRRNDNESEVGASYTTGGPSAPIPNEEQDPDGMSSLMPHPGASGISGSILVSAKFGGQRRFPANISAPLTNLDVHDFDVEWLSDANRRLQAVTQSSLPSARFLGFNGLPPELQRIIWTFAVPTPRVICFYLDADPDEVDGNRSIESTQIPDLIAWNEFPAGLPAPMFVDKETRLMLERGLYESHLRPSVDYFYFDNLSLRHHQAMYSAPRYAKLNRLERLVVDMEKVFPWMCSDSNDVSDWSLDHLSTHYRFFEHLTELVFIFRKNHLLVIRNGDLQLVELDDVDNQHLEARWDERLARAFYGVSFSDFLQSIFSFPWACSDKRKPEIRLMGVTLDRVRL